MMDDIIAESCGFIFLLAGKIDTNYICIGLVIGLSL